MKKDYKEFVKFLIDKGYEIKKKNPRHVPGQGYSPPPYYSNVDTESVVKEFETLIKKP